MIKRRINLITAVFCLIFGSVFAAGLLLLTLGSSVASASATCTIYWTGAHGTSWSTAGDWSLTNGGATAGRTPASTDYACMSTAPTNQSVSLTTVAAVGGINWPQSGSVIPSLAISGSLTVGNKTTSNPSTIAQLSLSGTLAGTSTVTIPVGGTLGLTSGYLSGVHVVNDGTATNSGAIYLYKSAELENAGTLNLTDNSELVDADGTGNLVQNDAGGTISYASTTSSQAYIYTQFNNAGAVNLTGNGILYSDEGNSTAGSDTGTYNAGSGTQIDFVGGTRTIANGSPFPGSGVIQVGGATLGFTVPTTAANLQMSGGAIDGPATVTIPIGGTLGLTGGSLSGAHLINRGTATDGGVVYLYKSAELENAGTLNLSDNSELIDADSTNNLVQNDAGGTIAYASATSGQAYIQAQFNNAGTVNLTGNGVFYIYGGNSTSGTDTGTYNAGSGTQILFASGTRTIASGSSFPGAGAIQVGGANVSFTAAVSIASAQQVSLTSGTLGFTAATTIPNLQVSGGTLDGPATVTIPVGGTLGLTGGSLSGVHVVNDGTATISNSPLFYSTSELENAGTLNLSDNSDLVDEDSTGNVVQNDVGGTIAYASSTGGTAYIQSPFNNAGAVNLTGNGVLDSYDGNSTSGSDTGSYNAASGTQIDFVGGTRTIASGSSFPGAGAIQVGGANVSFTAAVSIASAQQVSLTSGSLGFTAATTIPNLQMSGGTLNGPATVTIPVGGTLGLTSGSLFGAHLTNRGTATNNGAVYLYSTSELENAGTLNLSDNSDLVDADNTNNLVQNDAGGTIAYASTTSGQAYLQAPFNNAGAVNLTGNGVLNFYVGNSTSGSDTGSYNAGSGTQVDFASGTRTIASGSSFSGAGAIQAGGATLGFTTATTIPNLQVSGGTLDGPATVTIPVGGTLGLTGGSLTGTHLINQGTATNNGAFYFYSASELENAGTLKMSDSSELIDADSSGNLLMNDTGATVSYAGSTTGTAYLSVPTTNSGTLNVTKGTLQATLLSNLSAGTLTGGTYVATGTLNLGAAVTTNAATISIGTGGKLANGATNALSGLRTNSGSLTLGGSLTDSGALSNGGTVAITSGTLQPTTYSQSAGTTSVAAGAGLRGGSAGSGAITVAGGTLTGNGSVIGAVSGAGTVQPGSAVGALSVAGTYSPGAGGTLAIGIRGPSTPGTDFGQLSVSGAAHVAGTLALTTSPAFTPSIGSTITVLTSGALSGTFAAVTGQVDQAAGLYFAVSYNATSVILTATALPTLSVASASTVAPTTGTATMNVPVTLSAASLFSTTVNYATADGTAIAGTNYTATTGSITIPAGSTTGSIPVTILGEPAYGPTTTFSVTLSSPANATIASGTGTESISNPNPEPTLSVASASTAAPTTGTATMNVPVTLSAASLFSTTVNYATADGTAIAGTNYTAATGSITIPAGSTAGTIPVTILGEPVYGPTTAFSVTLSSPANATIASGTGTESISNPNPEPTLSVASGSSAAPTTGTATMNIPVTLSAASLFSTTVNYATADATAIAGTNYTATTGSITIPAGSTTGTVPVTILGEPVYGPTTAFSVILSSPTNATIAGGTGTESISNPNPEPTLSVASGSTTAPTTGTSTMNVPVTLSAASLFSTTVNYATANGTAIAGTNYLATSGSVTFPAGTTTGSIAVTILGEPVYGPTTAFSVTLSSPANATIASGTGTESIMNPNSALPQPSSVTPNKLGQGASKVVFTISGSSFASGSKVSISGTGVTLATVTVVNANTISASATVSASAALGVRNVSVTDTLGTGVCTGCLTIDQAPTVTAASPSGISQGASGKVVTFTGTGFVTGATLKVTGPVTTVKATKVTVLGTSTVTAAIAVPATAPIGAYTVTVVNLDGGKAVCTTCLSVIAAPTLTAISSPSVARGSTTPVTITGTGFATGLKVVGPSGVTFSNIVWVNATTITATMKVSATAPTGTNLSVTATNTAAAGYGIAIGKVLSIT